MKLIKILIVVFLTVVVYQWVNSSGQPLRLVEVFPFSVVGNHSFSYNWAASGLTILFIFGISKILQAKGKRDDD
jgi:hypothetical protein